MASTLATRARPSKSTSSTRSGTSPFDRSAHPPHPGRRARRPTGGRRTIGGLMDPSERTSCFAGIDWGGHEHQLCVVDGTGRKGLELRVARDVTGLGEFVRQLAKHGDRIPVAVERAEGLLVEQPQAHGHPALPVSPGWRPGPGSATGWPRQGRPLRCVRARRHAPAMSTELNGPSVGPARVATLLAIARR
ncbi:MAG TPA: transposase [Actinomycetota bacterium]